MGQDFKETAHNKVDPKKYAEGWDRIFGKKEKKEDEDNKDEEKKEEDKE